ncbi:MAG: protein kinase, partial [Myxococcales bacterium]|nr:protein kinase [Myxococcales bacterium]
MHERAGAEGERPSWAERSEPGPIAEAMTVLSTPEQSLMARASERPLPEVTRERYEVHGTFARGGVGKILRAREPHLDRTVALKELRRGTDQDSRERFIREARLTARLQHPGIVPVYDAGCWPDGEPFFSMKLVSGRSFARHLRRTGSLGERLALLPHVLAVAEAIAYAHSERIIHRDLKPENILLGDFGETVVIDWGLAKDLADSAGESTSATELAPPRATEHARAREHGHSQGGAHGPSRERAAESLDTPADAIASPAAGASRSSADESSVSTTGDGLTMVGTIMGTPAYMPPEQALGMSVDERADVYALGAILYHVLSGQAPYTGDDAVDVLRRVTIEPPPPLRRVQRGVPEELRAIVDKAMARRPEERYPTAREFAEDLRRFQTGKIVGAHRYTPMERVFRFVRRYRTALAVLAVLAIGGVISVGEVVREKQIADMQRAAAERAQAEAERERRLADIHSDELTLEQARLAVERDPARAITLLAGLSRQFHSWSAARVIAADAYAQGLPTVLRGHESTVNDVAYTPDGATLFTSSDDNTIRRWSTRTGELEQVYRGHEDEVWGISVSPDGRYLASSGKDRTARLWNLESGEVSILRGHEAGVFISAFSPD